MSAPGNIDLGSLLDPGTQPGIDFDPGNATDPGVSFDPGAQAQPGIDFDPGNATDPGVSFDPGAHPQEVNQSAGDGLNVTDQLHHGIDSPYDQGHNALDHSTTHNEFDQPAQ
jgi:hypothetical protein